MKPLARAISCLFSGLLLGQSPTGDPYLRGLNAQNAGHFEEAAAAYREVLQTQPSRFDARSNLGAVLVRTGRIPEAITEYQRALGDTPAEFVPRLRFNLAMAYYKSGAWAQASEELTPLRGTENVDLLIADCELQTGRPEAAATLLRPYVASSEKALQYVLGMALIESGSAEEGARIMDRLLKQGDTAEVHLLLGMSKRRAGDLPGAVLEFGRAAKLNPELATVHRFYGESLIETGDADGALQEFGEELRRNAMDFEANLRAGQIRKTRGQLTEAEPLLRRAVEQRPQSSEAKIGWIDLLLMKKDFAAAAAYLEPMRTTAPGVLHAQLAIAYRGLGRTREAAVEDSLTGKQAQRLDSLIGKRASPFTLPLSRDGSLLAMETFRHGGPAVILFGSYTCPNFRRQVPAIVDMEQSFGKRVPFLLVYIREAHTSSDAEGQWQSSINEREGVRWHAASTPAEMSEHATQCVRNLKLPFLSVVDDLKGTVENSYQAWPSRLVLVGSNGKVQYESRLSEFDFDRAAWQRALADVR